MYLDAELNNLALLSRKSHLEGVLSVRQPCCTAAVNGPEQLHVPALLILAGVPWLLHL